MKTVTLHFHSFAAKAAFNKRNKVAAGEIIAQGPGWQTMVDDGTNFAASPFVYSVA